ncbi:glycosyltransferase [Svornostia abyssi]|uniref:Glycosyltransferase n=1 Tax=Svornostia abyssi TaxID=2898438 RepID=A0ABY5PEL9_9ACTN|nr:glycosyltransferase [Parviterribacteraceae bacterium J379]
MSTPLVSVVIATKDRWPLLRRALAGVASQREVDLELIVVDDGSASRPPEDVRATIARYGELIPHGGPHGVAAARNLGLARARGDWIAFLDDDDLWAPDWLRAAVDAGVAGGAGLVAGAYWIIDADGTVRGGQPASDPADIAAALSHGNAIGGPSMVVLTTAAVRAAGGFNTRLSALADWELWLRMSRRVACATVDRPLVAYTLHQGNMHVRDPAGVRRELTVLEREGLLAPGARAGVERWMALDASMHRRRRRAGAAFVSLAVNERRVFDLFSVLRALTIGHRAPRAAGVRPGPLPW